MIQEKEEKTIGVLYDFFEKHPMAVVTVEFENERPFLATFDGDYETDNGLEIDEVGYEEFIAILLQRKDNGQLEELTYHRFPKRILWGNEVVAGTAAEPPTGEDIPIVPSQPREFGGLQ